MRYMLAIEVEAGKWGSLFAVTLLSGKWEIKAGWFEMGAGFSHKINVVDVEDGTTVESSTLSGNRTRLLE